MYGALGDAMREWDTEVKYEAARLIRSGTPPYHAMERAVEIVSERRRRKEQGIRPWHRSTVLAIAALILLSAGSGRAQQPPAALQIHHAPIFVKDWRWWIGEGVIITASVIDADSSAKVARVCPTCEEAAFILSAHPSQKAIWHATIFKVMFLTGEHIVSHRLVANDPSLVWRSLGYYTIPAFYGGLSLAAAGNNYSIYHEQCRQAGLVCR